MINTVSGKVTKMQTVIDSIKVGNIEETNKNIIAKTLCLHFAEVGMTYAKKTPLSKKGIDDYLSEIKPNERSLYLSPTNPSEILIIISNLANKHSSGWDGISNCLLKELGQVLCKPLSVLFNRSIALGIFPSIFKDADVIPLYKSGCTAYPSNYRLISLLLTMSKILEKIIYKRVYTFLDMTGQLYQSQYSFRTKHSCKHAVQELLGNVLKASENKELTTAIFLDLSRAFDSLEHHVLLKKIREIWHMGNWK